ncbi:MAG: hypothetical protein H0T51_23880, partial [Pirellulales bacterium]|nr:hypothetical protein [Pirellulales bacterium]
LLPGDEDYQFDFHWDDDIDGLGLATDGPIDTYIEIHPTNDWFADPTLSDDKEFSTMGTQKLFGGLTDSEKSTYFPDAAPPDALEVSFWRTGTPSSSALNTASASGQTTAGVPVDASTGVDLLSVILHEIGHILGVGADILGEPGEFNIYPHHVGGVENVLVLEGDGHLAGDHNMPGFLMNPFTPSGRRYYPSATDVLVISEDQGITDVRLQRVGSISSGIWADQSKWIGFDVPDVTQDVYIAHGGTVTLNANGQAKSLVISSGSVDAQTNRLAVDGLLSFNGAAATVGPGGTIAANSISAANGVLTTAAGSTVRFNSFTAGASASMTFNGNVAIGYDTSSPGQVTSTFDPGPNTVWNVAEQLAVGDENTITALEIKGGTVFTSTTGRIGASLIGGGTGHVNIHQPGSSWTIGGATGALDARNGTLSVFNKAFLQTGSTSIGGEAGQMHLTVNDGSWNANGSVDIGPASITGGGRGRLTVQNGGQATILGDVAVHGASTQPSEITVESGGRLQVDGQINVRQFGKMIYRDGTTANDTTFENHGATAANGSGGVTQFYDTATADDAMFTNRGGTAPGAGAGQTTFADNATADTATFINENADVASALGGFTAFFGRSTAGDASTAGKATFQNLGADVGGRGYTRFHDNASAGDATFTNKPSPSSGGATEFWGFSSAADATIINDTRTPTASRGGEILFRDNATAARAMLIVRDGTSVIDFHGHSTAAQSTIVLEDVQLGSFLRFWDDATAGSANITVGKAGYAQFYSRSDAGIAKIRVHAGTSSGQGNGLLSVSGSSSPLAVPEATLAEAIITLDGGAVGGAPGGAVNVVGAGSTAGDATITANGGTVVGASGGTIAFSSGGHAGRSTLIANGGMGGGGGGRIVFGFNGLGDFARVVLNGGILDLN